jgi:trigger factor
MKYKIRQSGKAQKVVDIYISKELVAEELNKTYREICKNASIAGFRVGKAPMELIKKRYKKEAQDEAMKNLVADSFKKAIRESDIDMLGFPEISDLQFDEEKGMSYKATINTRPEIKLKGYKGLKLTKVPAQGGKREIKESDIDSEINIIREINAKFVTKDDTAAFGDYIICDVECTVLDQPAEKKENVWLYVGDDTFIPGKPLEGLKVNDEKDVEKVLPKDYSKRELAEKKANFHIKVKEVKKKILPELNDEFLAMAGNFRSMAELRETIRQSIKKRNERAERIDLETQALKLLDDTAVFDIPQFMVDRHLQTLVNEAKERLTREGQYSEDEIKSMEENFREKLKAEAIRQVRAYFILDEIAKLEDMKTDDKEIENTFNMIASSTGRSLDEVRKYYKEKDLIEDVKEEIKQKKVLDFLIKNAKIT